MVKKLEEHTQPSPKAMAGTASVETFNFTDVSIIKKAFTLIELVVYLAIFSVFSLLIFGYVSTFYKKVFIDFKENKKIIRNTIVFDLLKRDLICASESCDHWNEKDFVFRKKHLNGQFTDVSWQMRKEGIYRLLGKYDFVGKKWIKKNVAKLDFDFYKFSFILNKDITSKSISSVNISFDSKEIFVYLRNRRANL